MGHRERLVYATLERSQRAGNIRALRFAVACTWSPAPRHDLAILRRRPPQEPYGSRAIDSSEKDDLAGSASRLEIPVGVGRGGERIAPADVGFEDAIPQRGEHVARHLVQIFPS